MSTMICIVCPRGCHMTVDGKETLIVSGNLCKRGEEYAINEYTNPVRSITSTVRISGAMHKRCPVKTDAPIPKTEIFRAMSLLNNIQIESPVCEGQIIVSNVCGLDVNFVSTRDM